MTPILFSALMLASGLGQAAERVEIEAWESGSVYVGLSEKEVVQRLGVPTAKKDGVWEYEYKVPVWVEVQPIWIVQFKDGKVISAKMTYINLGCRYPIFKGKGD